MILQVKSLGFFLSIWAGIGPYTLGCRSELRWFVGVLLIPPPVYLKTAIFTCLADTSASCRGKWRRVKGIGGIHASTLHSTWPTTNQKKACVFSTCRVEL